LRVLVSPHVISNVKVLEKATSHMTDEAASTYDDLIIEGAKVSEIAHGVWIEMFQKSKAR